MNFQIWVGDDNDRSCIAQFSAASWDEAIEHLRKGYIQPLAGAGWDCWEEEDGNREFSLFWSLTKRVDPSKNGLIKGVDYDIPDELSVDKYLELCNIADFAPNHPSPYSLE